ncbi:MAG TPA: hypothetical protein VKR81_06240, partial [Candidatus Binatia bacterium]|nr:hypothetical protein [Candidatus Binatia bacterium]
ITFLITSSIQGYAVFRLLKDPDWRPATPPFQIDPRTYSGLTNAAKMIFGSPLHLPLVLLKTLRRSGNSESNTDERNV